MPKRSPGRNELSDALSEDGVVLKSRSSEGADHTELGPVDHGLELGPAPAAAQLSPELLPLALPPTEFPFPPADATDEGVDPRPLQLLPPNPEELVCCC